MNQESIDRALNVKAKIVKETPKKIKDSPQDDFEYSRGQLYNLVEKGQEAIDGIMDVCQDSQHPRAYEVALNGIKQVSDTVDKLQDLNKKLKDLKELPKTADTKIQNALFVGSTAELQKMLKKDENTKSKVINTKHRDISDK